MLKLAAIISAAVMALWAMLIHASPRPTDQLAGKLIIATAVAVIGLALFVDRPWANAILMVTVIGAAAVTGYMLQSWSGRL